MITGSEFGQSLSQTPLIDRLVEQPASVTFDGYQAATAETAVYDSLFVDDEPGVMPYLRGRIFEEVCETLSSKPNYVLRMLGLVDQLPPDEEDNIRKEPGDILWYIAQIALQDDLSLQEVVAKQVRDSALGVGIDPHLSMDDYQAFTLLTPEIGVRTSKYGRVVTTAGNPLLTGSRMISELYQAYGDYTAHPLAVMPRTVEPIVALGSLLWWTAYNSRVRFDMNLTDVATQNLIKTRSRFQRGVDVVLNQSGDNR